MTKYDLHAKQHFFIQNPWASEGFFPGEGASKGFSQNYFQGGAKSGEMWFLPLEIEK